MMEADSGLNRIVDLLRGCLAAFAWVGLGRISGVRKGFDVAYVSHAPLLCFFCPSVFGVPAFSERGDASF